MLLVGVASLGGCASMDDMFAAEPDAVTPGGAPVPGSQGVPGKDQPTPNLAVVPDQAPKSQTTAAERQKIADQLIADNRQATYADRVNKPEQIEVAPPARTPNAPNKRKTDQKSDAPSKPEPGVSTTAPAPVAPSAPTASVQMGAAATQGAAPATTTAASAPGLIASSPGSPSTSALSPTPPPSAPGGPPPQTAGMPMPGSLPSPPPLPPVLQEAQASAPPPQAPSYAATAPSTPPPAPAAPPPVAAAPGPDTVVISGRSPRPLTEYVRKSAIAALVATIYFPENSAQIKPEDVTVLRQLALEQAKRGGTFRVVSIARSPIAEARAQEAAKILIDRGVNPGRVYAGTVPQNDPTFGQPRAESDSSNRRVDVYLDY